MIWTPEHEVHCLRIVPARGDPLRIVLSYPTDLTMGNGEIYQGGIYSQASAISSTINGSPVLIDLGSAYDPDTITRDEMGSGQWDGATIYSFYTSWFAPQEDDKQDRIYKLGKVREDDDRFVIEIMSQMDQMNQASGRIIKPVCENVLGDEHVDGTIIASDKSTCKVSPLLVSNTPSSIEAMTGPYSFIGEGLSGFPADFFGNGEIIFTSGPNVNLGYRKVSAFAADGNITLDELYPYYYPLAPGQTFLIRVGCRHRFNEDCIQKFSNAIHFRGFPHVPQKSSVIKFGDQ
jgi:uncharacterized phage protein (TIGR02218 family)